MKVIFPDGHEEALENSSLESLQAAVGGYIECIYVGDGKVLIVNEEGKLKDLEANNPATKLATEAGALFYGDYICGPAVLCDESELE